MNETKRINVEIPVELHKELRILAVTNNLTLAALVTDAMKLIVKESAK